MRISENKTTILFLSWRDIKAPKMGGAEIFTHEMLKRINKENLEIIHFSPEFPGCEKSEIIDNILYLRKGNILSVIKEAKKFYKKHSKEIDYVVDQCNTHRFFTSFWVPSEKRIFFIHQLTREIWFYHSSFPMNILGYLGESFMLRLNKNDKALTVSESTKEDLIHTGFRPEKICVLPEGLNFSPWDERDFKEKEETPTFIYVGRFAKYKGIDDSIAALAEVKKEKPKARLWIVGKTNEEYRDKELNPLCEKLGLSWGKKGENCDVTYMGFVSEEEKLSLMSRAQALVFPSRREGWGLTISEAAAVGTPSIVYNAPGTRDAVFSGEAGYITGENSVPALAETMLMTLNNSDEYKKIQCAAHIKARSLHWNRTARAFDLYMDHLIHNEEVLYV